MNPPVDPMAGRLEKLTPQQRDLLLRRLSGKAQESPKKIPRLAQPGEAVPLSPAQQRLWFFERLQPDSGANHVYAHYRLTGSLHIDAVQWAFSQLVRRHDSLRIGFSEVAGTPQQRVFAEVDFQVKIVDLSALADVVRETEMQRLASEETARPFDLQKAPLLRVSVLRLAGDDHLLMLVIHHIISDAWSRDVLLGEFSRLYAAHVTGHATVLPELDVQFPDVVLWQMQPTQQERQRAQLDFWRDALQTSTGVLELPQDRRPPATISTRGGRESVLIPPSVLNAATALARQEGATLFMLLLSVFQMLLARQSGQTDIVVGSPLANRNRPELEGQIGLFVNTLPLRGDLSGDPSLRQLLARNRNHCLDAMDRSEVPLERIIDELQPPRIPGRSPLFQALFVLQNTNGGEGFGLHGLTTRWLEPEVSSARFELTLSMGMTADGMAGVLDYNRDVFDPATMARFASQFETLLAEAVSAPDLPFARVAMLDPQQRAELLLLGDGGEPIASADNDLFGLLARQAATTPAAIALIEPGRTVTYKELHDRACGIGHALREMGACANRHVAILTDRSADAVIAVFGVLASGAAYVPLDPTHPDERLAFMLSDVDAVALLAPPGLVERAAAFQTRTAVLASADIPSAIDLPAPAPEQNDTAYVVYTSGSTGQPKGVVIEQRGAMNLVRGFLRCHDFNNHRLLMIPPLQFDASVGDLFPVLACGSTLVLHPAPAELGPAELQRYCLEQRVTAIDAPAALWRRWSEGWIARADGSVALPDLRLMMIGGESVTLDLVRRFARLTDGRVALHNHYGPTETSVCATTLETRDGSELTGLELPIGRPLPGVQLRVVDSLGQLSPRGAIGELLIGGIGVARGYLGQPQLTDASFVTDVYSEQPDARIYRTGDMVRWDSSDSLHFVGRRDHQVKLRGFRIELGEVEAVLQTHPNVQAAVAALREDRPGDQRLVVYFVSADTIDDAELREYLAQRLPESMQPSQRIPLAALPMTVNGKVDRRALPAPPLVERDSRTLRLPAGATEQGVLEVWRELLGRDDLGTDDDFFAVGGDSLSSLPLVFMLHAKFGVELPLSAVFATPTIVGLAQEIDDQLAGNEKSALDLRTEVHLPDEIDPRHATIPAGPRNAPTAALVTGATGFLGAYLIRELLDHTQARILCLVRADTIADGHQRVLRNLDTYALLRPGDEARLEVLLGDLASPLLGLGEAAFDDLAQRCDVIFHNGGQVNFLAPYEHMVPTNVHGTREVLRLATRTRVKPVHLVSTLGVYLTGRNLDATVSENDPPPNPDEQNGGYNQSKWVGEQLGLLARERGLPVTIHRPARITGDSRSGRSNLGDYFNAWIKGCLQLGLAPHLPDESFDMAPVDHVGRAIVRLALGAGAENGNFHYYNPARLPIVTAVACLRDAGYPLQEVEYPSWRRALLDVAAGSRDNALTAFALLFPTDPDPREPRFDCSVSIAALEPFGIVCPPADRTLFERYLAFLQSRDFLPAISPAGANG